MDYEKIIHTIVDPFLINPVALMIREIASTSEKDVTFLLAKKAALLMLYVNLFPSLEKVKANAFI